jgi:hypothetical protein
MTMTMTKYAWMPQSYLVIVPEARHYFFQLDQQILWVHSHSFVLDTECICSLISMFNKLDRSEISANDTSDNASAVESNNNRSSAAASLAEAETKVVRRMRVTVFTVLSAVSVAICIAAYIGARQSEINDFRLDFANLGFKFVRTFEGRAKQDLAMLAGFAMDYTSHAKYAKLEWPFVTLPDFHHQAGHLARIGGFMSVGLVTLVEDHKREAFVQFMKNDSAQQEGYALQLGLPTESVAPIPSFPDVTKWTSNGTMTDDTAGPFMVITQYFPSSSKRQDAS